VRKAAWASTSSSEEPSSSFASGAASAASSTFALFLEEKRPARNPPPDLGGAAGAFGAAAAGAGEACLFLFDFASAKDTCSRASVGKDHRAKEETLAVAIFLGDFQTFSGKDWSGRGRATIARF
jgi:hypothetical protein